jgi:hypothetical protein
VWKSAHLSLKQVLADGVQAGALPAAAANLIHASFNNEQTPDRPAVVDVVIL